MPKGRSRKKKGGSTVQVKARDVQAACEAVNRSDMKALRKLARRHGGSVFGVLQPGSFAAIHDAAGLGFVDALRVMVDSGADVNVKDELGMTALMKASVKGHVGVVEQLLAHNAGVDLLDKRGLTALWIAEKKGHAAIAALLREHGATR